MVLKKVSDPEVKVAAEALLGKEESDPGGEAPKGDSSDEDDAMLAERLHQASVKVTLTPRQEVCSRNETRSDVAAVDEPRCGRL